MFWKKTKFIDDELGELIFRSGDWGTMKLIEPYGEVHFSIVGTRECPDPLSLNNARHILKQLDEYVQIAKYFILSGDVNDFIDGNGTLVFDGFLVGEEKGQFDLGFGLSQWDDAVISAHFKNYAPYEISLGD